MHPKARILANSATFFEKAQHQNAQARQAFCGVFGVVQGARTYPAMAEPNWNISVLNPDCRIAVNPLAQLLFMPIAHPLESRELLDMPCVAGHRVQGMGRDRLTGIPGWLVGMFACGGSTALFADRSGNAVGSTPSGGVGITSHMAWLFRVFERMR